MKRHLIVGSIVFLGSAMMALGILRDYGGSAASFYEVYNGVSPKVRAAIYLCVLGSLYGLSRLIAGLFELARSRNES